MQIYKQLIPVRIIYPYGLLLILVDTIKVKQVSEEEMKEYELTQ